MTTPEEMAASALAGFNEHTSPSPGLPKVAPAGVQGISPVLQKNEKSATKKTRKKGPRQKTKIVFPVEPRVIQTIPKRKDYVNHSYRDFSQVPPELNYEPPKEIKDMSFSEKVHDMLSHEEFSKYMSFLPHGRSFRVTIPVMFEKHICQQYFGHKRYSSFLRQLNNHGFKHITKGPDRNAYYHECFLRGMPHLCKYMPDPKDARRQIPDPINEPDFYAISRAYPVGGAAPEDSDQAAQVPIAAAAPMLPPVASVLPTMNAVVMIPPAQGLEATNLGTRLASDVSGLGTTAPPAKRLAVPGDFLGQTTFGMPQPLPTVIQRIDGGNTEGSTGGSPFEAALRHNALLALQAQQPQEKQPQQLQEKQSQQLQEKQPQQLQGQQQLLQTSLGANSTPSTIAEYLRLQSHFH